MWGRAGRSFRRRRGQDGYREDAMRAGCGARASWCCSPCRRSPARTPGTGPELVQRSGQFVILHADGRDGSSTRQPMLVETGSRRRRCGRPPTSGSSPGARVRLEGTMQNGTLVLARLRDGREADRALAAAGRSAETCGVAVDAQHGGGPVRVHRRPHAEPADDRPCVGRRPNVRRSADHAGLAATRTTRSRRTARSGSPGPCSGPTTSPGPTRHVQTANDFIDAWAAQAESRDRA